MCPNLGAIEMHSGPYLVTSTGDNRYFGQRHSYPEDQRSYPISEPTLYYQQDERIGVSWSDDERLIMSQQQPQPQSHHQDPIEPHEHDVLMGRGGRNNQHSGNEILRQFARVQKDKYVVSSKKGKSALSRLIVRQMRELDPPARFLKRVQKTGAWEEVGDDTAREKASQVLRDAVAGLFEGKDVSPIALSATSASVSVPVTREEHEQHYASRGRASVPRPDYQHSMAAASMPSHHHRHHHSEPPSAKRRRHSSETYAHYDPRYSSASSTQVVGYSPLRRHSDQSFEPPLPRSDHTSRRSAHLYPRHPHPPPPPPPPQYPERGQRSDPNLDEFDLFHGELLDSDIEEEAQAQMARQPRPSPGEDQARF